jgi:hypothetical protein
MMESCSCFSTRGAEEAPYLVLLPLSSGIVLRPNRLNRAINHQGMWLKAVRCLMKISCYSMPSHQSRGEEACDEVVTTAIVLHKDLFDG